jgi:hypothetical protein
LLARWRAALLRSDRAILSVVRWMDRWLFGLDGKSIKFRAYVRVHGIHLLYWRHFRYASLAPLGLHAGSGVTEGACKSIIKMRTHRSGQRWTKKGVDGVLTIASLLESERLALLGRISSATTESTASLRSSMGETDPALVF